MSRKKCAYFDFQHNFTGMHARGGSASKRRSKFKRDARDRWTDGRTTHFVVGYTPFDFSSESQMKYKGEPKTDAEVPPAGIDRYFILTESNIKHTNLIFHKHVYMY